jgi:hypothetical protein
MTPLALDDSARRHVRRLALAGDAPVLRGDEVFLRSWMGRLELARAPGRTPRRLRALLLRVDGCASVDQLRRRHPQLRYLDEGLDMLRKMGLIEPLPPALG